MATAKQIHLANAEVSKKESIVNALNGGVENIIAEHARLQKMIANWKQFNDTDVAEGRTPTFSAEDMAELIGIYNAINAGIAAHASTWKIYREDGQWIDSEGNEIMIDEVGVYKIVDDVRINLDENGNAL